ncbi:MULTISPECIES: Crp/Fnr family transcriptional regulator [Cohnella]|uniref:Crp/Fnr family transcriptional regulator n=1 Tax=Cohnella TaxID=329857 RepID=UPI0009BBCBFF|nr:MULTISPECIES: Crp/Fnr family transcriptional regulator [Cohnella]MBN2984860.1 Crp/Fnr family transcriptional regulator [Cohnella algarum]
MIQWIRNVALFDGLSDKQLEHVYKIANSRSYAPGTVLFHEKEPGSTFYIVLSGSVKLFTRSSSGEEKVLTVAAAGDSFGELALLDGRPRSASAQTLESTLVLEISYHDFMALLEAHFDITRGILSELCNRLRETNEHVNDLTFLDGRTRVLKNLIQLANKHGKRDGLQISIHVALNFDELAQKAGVTKALLSDVLRELESKGVLSFGINEYKLNLSKLKS